MSPEALRRRMAHGNIYRPEHIDASLTSYFRVGNLTALRELALLWLADRVDDALDDYRRAHRIEDTWPAKERIVVAVTGGPESETLLRRGARLAQRAAGSELLAVHVIATDGLRSPDERRLAARQQLVASLDGTFHSVVGEDVSAAVVDFASGANATMIVVGVSRHGRLRRLFTGTTGDRIASLAGSIDVHLVTHERGGPDGPLPRRALVAALAHPSGARLGWRRSCCPSLLTAVLQPLTRSRTSSPWPRLLFLARPVAGRAGRRAASRRWSASLVGFLLLNWFFTPPVGRLTVSEPENLVALFVYVAVAVGRRHRGRPGLAPGRRGHAGPHRGGHPRRPVAVGAHRAGHRRGDRGAAARDVRAGRRRRCWRRTPAGWAVRRRERGTVPGDARTRATPGCRWTTTTCSPCAARRCGRATSACSRGSRCRPSLVLEYRRLRAREDRAAALESAEATSTALLRAVSHDLRTPLATMRASVDGLVSGDRLDADDQPALVAALAGVDRPARAPHRQPARPVPAPVRAAQAAAARPARSTRSCRSPSRVIRPDAVSLEVDESVPMVRTDAGLLERVVANLVGNAVRRLGRPAGAGARPRAARDRRDHGRRPGTRRTPRPAGADVRAVPAARRHLAGRARPRAGRGPRPDRGDRRRRSPRRTPRAAG